MTRFRDMPREELPGPTLCLTIGKGDKERPLSYASDTNRATRRAYGRFNHFRQRVKGIAIPHEETPWHRPNAHVSVERELKRA